MLSLYQCIVVYLELDYTPDLYSNIASSALPSWLSLCRLFLYLSCMTKQSIKLDGSLGAIASSKLCKDLSLGVRAKQRKVAVLPVVLLCLPKPSHFLLLDLFSIDRMTSQQGDVIMNSGLSEHAHYGRASAAN